MIKFSYIISKENKYIKASDFNILTTYSMNFKNGIDGFKIDKIVIINEVLIEKTINKKISKKFKSLLEMLAKIEENDNEDPSGALMIALTEAEKFKRETINKYNRLLKKEQTELIEKKLKLIEKEIEVKLYTANRIKKQQDALYQALVNESLNYQGSNEMTSSHRR